MVSIRSALMLMTLMAVPALALDLSRRPQGGDELLSADQAFQLVSTTREADGLHFSWVIAPGYYLYRHRMTVEAVDGAASLGTLSLPKGTPKHDAHFGDVEIYTTGVDARLPLANGVAPAQVKLRWQGCAEAGVCYPPVTRVVAVTAAP